MENKLNELEKELGNSLEQLKQDQPLILTFYVAMQEMGEDIFKLFVGNVQSVIKEHNILAFFLPVAMGKERVECINPIIYEKSDLEKLYTTISKIETHFLDVTGESLNDESSE